MESMLGAHPDVATMGELHLWPHELRGGGVRPCSCGESVLACPFWSEVQRRTQPLRPDGPGLDFFRQAHNAGRTLRPSRLRAFVAAPGPREQALLDAYARHTLAVVRAFQDVHHEQLGTRPGWVVDASKDPYRLLWLVRSGLFDVTVLHVVKNPRGFVYSVTRPLLGGNDAARLWATARQAGAWTVQNRLVSAACRLLPPEKSMLVRYEAFATDPAGTFAAMCAAIGCAYDPDAVARFREGSVHTIAGNPMRYETRPIELDERWKTALPRSSRRLAELVTASTRAHYGYR
jgi:hypothetical protein